MIAASLEMSDEPKKAYRWDAEQMTWTPAYLLTWRTEGPTLQKLSENK